MKTSLKIILLAVALIVMNGCSAQRRAERLVRRAVALCPELVQVKAHPIDTVLTVSGFADCTRFTLHQVTSGDTLYHATDHGTFLVSMERSTNEIRVGFIAMPRKIHLTDTVHYAQVILPRHEEPDGGCLGDGSVAGFLCVIAGIVLAACLLFRNKSQKP